MRFTVSGIQSDENHDELNDDGNPISFDCETIAPENTSKLNW